MKLQIEAQYVETMVNEFRASALKDQLRFVKKPSAIQTTVDTELSFLQFFTRMPG
jgi:hypothetical protein